MTSCTPSHAERVDERERARDRPDATVETELTEDADALEGVLRQVSGRDQEAERDGELEAGSGLADGGRRQVDRDPALRPSELRRQQGGADPFARLTAGRVGEPDDAIAGADHC